MKLITENSKNFVKLSYPYNIIKKPLMDTLSIEGSIVKFYTTFQGIESYNTEDKKRQIELPLKGIKSFSVFFKDGLHFVIKDALNRYEYWFKNQDGNVIRFFLTIKEDLENFYLRPLGEDLVLICSHLGDYFIWKLSENFERKYRIEPGVEREKILSIGLTSEGTLNLYSIIEFKNNLTDHHQISPETFEYVEIPILLENFELQEET